MMGIILIYVLFSVSGLLMLKIGAGRDMRFQISQGTIDFSVNYILVLGLCCYIVSFVLSLVAMKTINLSVFYPLSTGLAYVFVCLASYLILKEAITWKQLMGMTFVLVGVVLMNLKN